MNKKLAILASFLTLPFLSSCYSDVSFPYCDIDDYKDYEISSFSLYRDEKQQKNYNLEFEITNKGEGIIDLFSSSLSLYVNEKDVELYFYVLDYRGYVGPKISNKVTFISYDYFEEDISEFEYETIFKFRAYSNYVVHSYSLIETDNDPRGHSFLVNIKNESEYVVQLNILEYRYKNQIDTSTTFSYIYPNQGREVYFYIDLPAELGSNEIEITNIYGIISSERIQEEYKNKKGNTKMWIAYIVVTSIMLLSIIFIPLFYLLKIKRKIN